MSSPQTQHDWFTVGIAVGLREPLDIPTETIGSPPLMQPYLDHYYAGIEAARAARRAYDEEVQSLYTGPYAEPAPDVIVTIDEFEEPARTALESLFHKHMPHVELPEYEPSWYPPLRPPVTGPPPPSR